MSIGAIAAAAGSVLVFLLGLRTFSQQGLDISGAVLPAVGAVVLGAAAFLLRRFAPVGSSIALTVWVLLGVIPSGIPLWLGLAVLVLFVSAARGAFVLRRLTASG
jgi:hypothetical protein